MEKVYAHMTVDLDTSQEYKQQIPKNWKARKKKANPRDLDSSVPRSMVQEGTKEEGQSKGLQF
jgi:hypothetical protein